MATTPTILIIEDDEVLLAALSEKLQHVGYNVLAARDGVTGETFAKTKQPDLILLDLLLPKKNGLEILEEIKRHKHTANIPVVVISNSGQPVEIKKLLELGANEYLVKAEFEPQEVLDKIKKFLGPTPSEASANVTINTNDMGDTPKTKGNGDPVLVVEDDKFLRDLMIQKLIRSGFHVEQAIDGNEALQKLTSFRPKIILLDLVLPGIDGFAVLAKIKADKELSKIPVIVLSNLGQQEDINRAKSLGAQDYLVKAYFTLDEIVTKIKALLKEIYSSS